MSRLLEASRKHAVMSALVTVGALMAITGGALGAGSRQTFALEFVSTTPADLTHPYPRASFEVSRPAQKRANIYTRVQLVTSCSDGATLLGGLAWVSTSGDTVAIEGIYSGSDCSAWVYNTGGKNVDPYRPDSNIESFSG